MSHLRVGTQKKYGSILIKDDCVQSCVTRHRHCINFRHCWLSFIYLIKCYLCIINHVFIREILIVIFMLNLPNKLSIRYLL